MAPGRTRHDIPVGESRQLNDFPEQSPQTRRKQPDRQPPNPWNASRRRPRSSSLPAPSKRQATIDQAERNQRKHDNWAEIRAELQNTYITTFDAVTDWSAKQRALNFAHYTERIDVTNAALLAAPPCGCAPGSLEPQGPKRQCYLHSESAVGVLYVQDYKCKSCNKTVAVQPEQIGCFRLTPRNPGIWLDQMLLEKVRLLSASGLSVQEFCKIHNHIHQFYDPNAMRWVDYKGRERSGELDPRQLTDAYIAYGLVEVAVRDSERGSLGDADGLRDCPVCAFAFEEKLEDGTDIPHDYPPVLATDAGSKGCRFGNAGCSDHTKPVSKLYLGDTGLKVLKEYCDGTFDRQAKQRCIQVAEAEAEADSEGLAACTSNLYCSRPVSSSRSQLHIFGILGACCAHGIVPRGGVIAMFSPENHYYYETLLRKLIPLVPFLRVVYLDIACQFKKRFDMLVGQLARGNVSGADVDVKLPLMHARDHNQACQLQHSALYTANTGRRIGFY